MAPLPLRSLENAHYVHVMYVTKTSKLYKLKKENTVCLLKLQHEQYNCTVAAFTVASMVKYAFFIYICVFIILK